ncbi:MAG: class I SAM-dependent methyltransferase [Thermodesulfobacteriota bacterium]
MDPRKLLAIPVFYSLFRKFIGRDSVRRQYSESHIRAQPGQHVLDIGCGTGDILAFLPEVQYVGFDIDPDYIQAAQQRYGSRGTFFCQPVGEGLNVPAASFDIVIAHGILHHLDDDEAKTLFRIAHKALKPGGRLITFDGCFSDDQSRLSRFFVSRDRGCHVRRRQAYEALALTAFAGVKVTIRHDLLRIPYTHIILECLA